MEQNTSATLRSRAVFTSRRPIKSWVTTASAQGANAFSRASLSMSRISTTTWGFCATPGRVSCGNRLSFPRLVPARMWLTRDGEAPPGSIASTCAGLPCAAISIARRHNTIRSASLSASSGDRLLSLSTTAERAVRTLTSSSCCMTKGAPCRHFTSVPWSLPRRRMVISLSTASLSIWERITTVPPPSLALASAISSINGTTSSDHPSSTVWSRSTI
mmetsp:Transcript_49941/g.106966  ORF Transcript_49941/g.106966 Transcript_49941/m.106966 type:complete len:217 (-) Transcript_49941:186-836(-)